MPPELASSEWAKLFYLLTTFVSFIAYFNARGQRKIRTEVRQIQVILNGRLDELLQLTRIAAHAAGMKEQKDLHEADTQKLSGVG